jgi:hypothetical protein
MKQIHYFQFKIGTLQDGEHFQFHLSVDLFLQPLAPSIPDLEDYWNLYHGKFIREDLLYRRDVALEEADELIIKNRVRTENLRLLGKSIDHENRSPIVERKELCERLKNLYRPIKGSTLKAMAENTVVVEKFLAELNRPANRMAVQMLALVPIVESLRENNDAVKILLNRHSESAEFIHEEGSLNAERMEVDASYEKLTDKINAIYRANEYGEKDPKLRRQLEEIINGVNTCIVKTGHTYVRRVGSKPKNQA